jgi:hypothetical protein
MKKRMMAFFCFLTLAVFASEEFFEQIFSDEVEVLAFYPRGTHGFFAPGESPKLTIFVQNASQRSISGEVSLAVKDLSEETLEQKRMSFTNLFPGEKRCLDIVVSAPEKHGYFTVLAVISQGDKRICATQTGFAVATMPEHRDPFFGLDSNCLPDELIEGYRMIGAGTLCFAIRREPPAWFDGNWEKYMDWIIGLKQNIINAGDFRLVGFIAPRVSDNAEVKQRIADGLFPLTDSYLQNVYDYSERIARIFRDRIKMWMVREEIDASYRTNPPTGGSGTGTLAAYVLITRKAYQGVKKGNPAANVSVLGINGDDYFINNPPFLASKMLLEDLKPNFDFLCIDAYSGAHNTRRGNELGKPEWGPRGMERKLKDFLLDSAELSASYGLPRLVINAERGYGTNYFAKFDSQANKDIADYTVRSLIITRATPTPLYVHHYAAATSIPENLKRGRYTRNDKLMDYGLWKAVYDENGKFTYIPKPVAVSYANAAKELAFVREGKEVRITDDVYSYVFRKKDGQLLAVIWSVRQPVVARLDLPDGEMTDLSGNRSIFSGGTRDFELSSSPIFLTFSLPVEEACRRLSKTEFPYLTKVVGEGRRAGINSMSIVLVNQTTNPIKGKIILDGVETDKVTVVPQKITEIKTILAEKAELELPNGSKYAIKLDTAAYMVEKTSVPRQTKAIKLEFPRDIRPQSALIPELNLFKFDGTDITAEIYLSWDEHSFHIEATVNDPVHIQRKKGANIWMDDAFQFVFSTRFDAISEEIIRDFPQNRFSVAEWSFGMALTTDGAELFQWGVRGAFTGKRDFPMSVKREGKATLYKVAIPWKALDISPFSGMGLRFSALFMDNNRTSDALPLYWIGFGEGLAGGQDIAKFKTLILK